MAVHRHSGRGSSLGIYRLSWLSLIKAPLLLVVGTEYIVLGMQSSEINHTESVHRVSTSSSTPSGLDRLPEHAEIADCTIQKQYTYSTLIPVITAALISGGRFQPRIETWMDWEICSQKYGSALLSSVEAVANDWATPPVPCADWSGMVSTGLDRHCHWLS